MSAISAAIARVDRKADAMHDETMDLMNRRSRFRATAIYAAAVLCPVLPFPRTQGPGSALSMKAIVYRDFGAPGVLRLEKIDKPVPNDQQVLVHVRAASVNPLDWHYMEGTPYIARMMEFGFLKPKVQRLGVDFAGTVEAVGGNVTWFKPGDEVLGARTGAFAEYICVRADRSVVLKPANVTFEQAAAVPIAGVTALQGLRDKGELRAGQKVLINGASGGVGTFAVQIAKSIGADVTGVCSTRNVGMVQSIGADRVIDYTQEDFTAGASRYDVILDNVGNHSLLECRRVLSPGGKYVLIGGGGLNDDRWLGPIDRLLEVLVLSPFVSQHMGMMLAETNKADLTALCDLMQAGKVTPVIDRRYQLSEVPAAIRYLEAGHAKGKVVITIEETDDTTPLVSNVAADSASTIEPGLIALVLIAVPLGVMIVPIVAALVLNRRFQRRNPGKRPYRWGYYFSILSFIAGIGLGVALESGVSAAIICAVAYAVLAWCSARRNRWAWVVLTIVSFNPLAWIINAVYFRNRWAESAGAGPTT
jgi:NADPH:quinone reductase-like Zn-dependent oxidoreductase